MTDRLIKIRFIGQGITTVAGQVTALGKSVGTAADKMTSAEKEAAKFRRGLDTTGRTAGRVGLVAAAGLGAVVIAAANFDQAMSNVAAATHESASNMEDLRKAAIKAGADTVFSASEAAGAIENLAKAGVSTKDILAGGLNGALSLAASGGLAVADAAEIAATALTQFGLSGQDVPHIADLLAAGAGKAQGDVTDLSFALKQSGLVASQMGISIEETTGALAAFASAGLLGSDAGTSFRTMLLRLANPSAQSAKLMDQLGISAYDAQGNFVGLQALAGQLTQAFQDKTQAERDSALATIFGTDAIRAANVLYSQGAQGIADWTAKVNDSGYAAETASIRMDNLRGDLEQFRGSLETALIGAGEGSQGPLRKLVQGLTDVTNAFNNLPGPAKNAATSLLAITAVTGGALWFGSKVVGSIAKTRVALAELGVQAKTTRSVLAGVGKGLAVFAAIEGVQALNSALVDSESSVRRWQETLLARSGPDLKSQLAAVNAEIKKQQEIANSAFGPTFSVFGTRVSPFEFGSDWKNAQVRLDALKETQADLKHQMELGAIAAAKQTDAIRVGGTTAGQSADEIAAAADALQKARDAADTTAREFTAFGDSLDDPKVSLHDWITELETQAKALEDFTKNAKKAGKNGLKEGLIQQLEQAGPAGALRLQQLADASEAEIKRANRAWKRGERAVADYIDEVAGVPPTVATELEVHVAAGERALRRILTLMQQVPPRLRTEFLVTQTSGLPKHFVPGQAGQADGGTIQGSRWPYGDKVLTPMAPGEEVISNRRGQADRWRPLLKAINAGMADGGTVGRMPAGALSPSITQAGLSDRDVDRIAGALLSARSLYGDVHVTDGYGGFKRQMEADRRLSSLSGRRP